MIREARDGDAPDAFTRMRQDGFFEDLKNSDVLNVKKSQTHRDWLQMLRLEHRLSALSLDLRELRGDVNKLYKDQELFTLLRKIQDWTDRGDTFESLKAPFLKIVRRRPRLHTYS